MNHIPLLKMAVHCSNLALSLNSNLTFGTNNSDNTISMVIDWLLVVGTARIEQGRHTRVILHAQHCKVIFKQTDDVHGPCPKPQELTYMSYRSGPSSDDRAFVVHCSGYR